MGIVQYKSRDAHHPVTALVQPVSHNIDVDRPGGLIVARLDGASQLRHVRNGVGLEQVLVIEVVEQDVQPPFSIIDLCLEGRRGPRLHALHVCGEDLVDRHGVGRDVGTVTRGYEMSETEATKREV